MLAPDIPVWYRFLNEWGEHFTALYYDCLLGGPALDTEGKRDPMKRMWHALVSKRADAIAETRAETWIIEVSACPGMRALGQLLTYKTLWLEDPKIDKPAVMVLVADKVDGDVMTTYKPYGINLHLV